MWAAASANSDEETLLRVEEIPGRGRALVSSVPLNGGQIVLRDSPILLYSAFPFSQQPHPYCAHCFRSIHSAAVACPSCSLHYFCTPNCLSLSLGASHTPWVCQSLIRLRDHFLLHPHPPELHLQARFLVASYNLAILNPPNFRLLLSLQGDASNEDAASAHSLHSLISTLCPPPLPAEVGISFSPDLTMALLAKDKLNSFGLMEPPGKSDDVGQRSVRAYGIYPKASLFNHDCLPNACRFDYVDAASNYTNNTDIIIRMIHDVPQGREICLSYFPVNLNYSTRQKRLQEDYGFSCDCDRCKVEANWSDNDDDDDDDENMDEEEESMMEEEEALEGKGNGEGGGEEFPHAYFFMRYMCSNGENCGGTLAPLPPPHAPNLLECNVCGNLKNDDFL